ncbi:MULTISPECIES: linear amide C-N hydrolase [unclassified Francisella]|uniref:linear amide C-N hydrolase n=1 Tax=unclassified Francisella TaxID=2610885 RepID=UPI002E370F9B|nr:MULTISPECIES: linear amide C-N hydrolase [unclassified Francisella]MED7820186.1 linear amide C-N hydrolase [Francisella sp. 19S2-4]MED7831006.1 linear amide C-N hydrolase [Francisella sp. 19S2-10]
MKKLIHILIFSIILLGISHNANACSELNHNFGNNLGIYTARTIDIFIDLKPTLTVYPRGIKENGGLSKNSLSWINKYGYISVDETNINNLTGEGINEKGLAAHLLYLGDTIQPQRNISKPGINGLFWVRYVLGNFSSVKEVIENLNKYQIYVPPVKINNKKVYIPIHYMIEDKTGDSALIEYVNGKLKIYRNINAISNEPNYEQQQKILDKAKKLGFYNIDKLPGGANSGYRFVRTNYISENLPEAISPDQAVNYMFSAIDSVSVPFIKGYRNENLNSPSLEDKWPTQWKSVISLSENKLYIVDTLIGNRTYISLNDINLEKGQPIRSVSIMNGDLVGNISNNLTKRS